MNTKTDRAIAEAATPDKIWLIDCGDVITWCNEQYPDSCTEEADTAEYIKASSVTQMLDERDALREALQAFIDTCNSGYDEEGYFIEDYNKAKEVLGE